MTTPDRELPMPPAQQALFATIAPFLSVFNGPIGAALQRPGIANFAFGNPNELPLPDYVASLHRHLDPL